MIKSPPVVAALVLVACQACLGADEITKERFLKEYQAALPRLKSAYEHVRISGFWREHSERLVKPAPDPPDPRPPEEYFVWRSGGRRKFRLDRDDRLRVNGRIQIVPTGRIMVIDGDQSFGLIRTGNHPVYRLQYKPLPRMLVLGVCTRLVEGVVDAPLMMLGVEMSKLTAGDAFTLESVTILESGGRKRYKATFVYRPVGEKLADVSGWFTVVPGNSWVLEEADVVAHDNGANGPGPIPHNIHIRNEYDDTGKIPKPTGLDWRDVSERYVRTMSFKTTSWDFQETPAKEFTMESYGVKPTDPPLGNNAAARGVK